MKSLFPLVLLVVGVALLVWGYNAFHSVSSNTSEALGGAPSTKAIVLLGVGAIAAVIGVVRLARKT
jgi:TRAP-type C4-dicarboxylate transport system permease small subunit